MNWLYLNYIKRYYNDIKKDWKSQDKETRRCIYLILILFSFILFSTNFNLLNRQILKIITSMKQIKINPYYLADHRYIPNHLIKN